MRPVDDAGEMLTLALDVDGVLLDPERGGQGCWTNELTARFGIEHSQIGDAFFARCWDDVIIGRRSVEDGLGEALRTIGLTVDVEAVLACWFDADYVPFEEVFRLARRAARAGCRVVLATDQEHRRAEHLRRRIGAVVPLAGVFYSAEIGYQKHDPRFFDKASECLGLGMDERSTVVFVDDHAANVAAARSAGWRGVHATPGGAWPRAVEQLLGLKSATST